MKHLTKRIAALAMACAMTLTLVTAASAADFVDMPEEGHWSTAALEAAVDNGLLKGGSDGLLNPTGKLTRAEMAAIVVRAFGTTQSASVAGFTDVNPNAWYVTQNALPGAYFMQIMQGDGAKMNPGVNITREQAFTILARALKLDNGSTSTLAKFDDGASVGTWYQGPVAAMVEAGFISGSNNKLNPGDNITRAEFAQVMYNIFNTNYITAAGTYGADDLGEKSVMISVSGVTIKDATVHGDVIVGEGVGEGDVYFDNVTIEGRVVVRGGGVNSIHFINSDTAKVIVSKIEGLVRVVTDKASTVPEVAVVGGANTVTVEGSVTAVTVDSDTPVVVKDATVTTVTISSDKAAVEITGTSTVAKVEAEAGTVTASGEAKVTTITTTGGDVKVADTATVTTIEVPETAANVTVSVADTAKVTTVKADTNITLDGAENVSKIEAPKDVTVSDSKGDEVATTTPSTPSVSTGGSSKPPAEEKPTTPEGGVTQPGTQDPSEVEDNREQPGVNNNFTVDNNDGLTAGDKENEDGSKVQMCEAANHQFVGEVTTDSTCTSKGVATYTCSVCGASKTEELNMLDHNWYKAGGTAATCAAAGTQNYKCTSCSETKSEPIEKTNVHTYPSKWTYADETNHKKICTVCKNEDTAAHTGGEFAADAGADTHSKTCTDCGGKYATAEHSYSAGSCTCGAKITAATCPNKEHHEATNAEYTCTQCGFKGSADETPECTNAANHAKLHKDQKCPNCDVTGNLDHTFSGEETNVQNATCCTDGSKTVKCTGCDATENQTIPATDKDHYGTGCKLTKCTCEESCESCSADCKDCKCETSAP